MLKFMFLFVYLIYFTSLKIKRFKGLCYNMDTLYLLGKMMPLSRYIYPLAARYRPGSRSPMPSQSGGMMMFVKFFWEIFLDEKKTPI